MSGEVNAGFVSLVDELDHPAISSASTAPICLTVQTVDLCFAYGGKKARPILDMVSINVQEASIYGLLGPSGCGKTSLLRCLLGQLRPRSGTITVLGQRPGGPGAVVPGPGAGLMPQEVALYTEFTVSETVTYFGQLYGMSKESTRERSKFLLKFLRLDDARDQLVRELSGGQKRRVSLAAALVHSPPLLILDEPTVGVDPLLRENIWDYLVDLAKTERMSIMITTHYIEEARRANTVALLRDGRLLAEDNPTVLMAKHSMSSLELVFLKICQHVTASEHQDEVSSAQNDNDEPPLVDFKGCVSGDEVKGSATTTSGVMLSMAKSEAPVLVETPSMPHTTGFGGSINRIKTLMTKSLTRLRRNIPFLVFQILIPAFEIVIFCLCIGRSPTGLKVAVYNPDFEPSLNYSQLFLGKVAAESMDLIYHDSKDSALQAVKDSKQWAALVFAQNYSSSLKERMFNPIMPDNETIEDSTVYLYADMTEFPIQVTIMESLQNAGKTFMEALLNRSTSPIKPSPAALTPMVLSVDPPVYGNLKPNFRDFMTPGFVLGITYILAVGHTAMAFVLERKDGLLERTNVAGVKSFEYLLSHLIVQILIIVAQAFFLLLFIFYVFDIELRGSLVLVVLMVILQGITGMSFGYLISSVCYEEQTAMMLAMGAFYPNLMLSGMVWPLEGMPASLRSVAYFLPQTYAIESFRSIIGRGLSLDKEQVYLGFVSTASWLLIFNTAAVVIFAYKQR